MKKTLSILILLSPALGASASQSISALSCVVDTRDYVLDISSPYGEMYPATGTITQSWHSTVSGYPYESPLFESDGTVLRNCSGFSGTGISPASGNENSAVVKLLNVTSTLVWNWSTSYWVTQAVSGQGDIFGGSGSAGWYNEGQDYLLKARPDYGWLFTGWSGGSSGGPEATNLYFTATEPTNLQASFSDDPDGDGLLNTNEWASGANPWLSNTDGDPFDDKQEFDLGLSPTRDSTAFVDYIRNNSADFNLYPSNAVLDVALGQVLLTTTAGNASVSLQLEKSDDLVTWTNAGDAVTWSIPIDQDKQFIRVQSIK